MRRLVMVFLACFSVFARAQQAEPSTSAATVTATTPAVAPATPPLVTAEEDKTVIYTDDDRVLFGADRREVQALELFGLLGRTDLLERSVQNQRRRTSLIIAAGVVAAVGVGIGVGFLATSPNFQTGRCNTDLAYHNEVCVPSQSLHQAVGVAGIVGGVAIAGILASVAWWSRPEVFTRYELRKFIEEHNATAKGGAPVTFDVTPAVGPSFSGLVARGTF